MEKLFPISFDARLGKMSKGMQRQAAILLGLSTQPRCILFDEIFDGLDPVVRELVKKLLVRRCGGERRVCDDRQSQFAGAGGCVRPCGVAPSGVVPCARTTWIG